MGLFYSGHFATNYVVISQYTSFSICKSKRCSKSIFYFFYLFTELASAVSVPIPLPPPPFRPGAVDFANEALDEEQKCLEAVLYRLKGKIQQRRIMAKPVFQDFDR